ncbi:uncharacterized protein LOC127730515 isoform X2 [Mytilus californianus]|uniref:uncharacterized protein LOC127730515 isoform X2 n=1 Tax=Mytilus californianus TaxID=6549 RepID=UPI00224640F7|nr:uncharacterized protein LOC127730515 isoform X2 [Mytilus californianus]
MNFKFLIAWSSVWLPLTIGQGCPYSRTVVPGDAKRYIEMVHNIAHERHCAPGTEFDPASCECSLLSSIPWSTGASLPLIHGTDYKRPKSKRRKSKTAEFSYKPGQNGIASPSFDLLSLLSQKPLLGLFPSRQVDTPVEKSTPQLRGLSQTIPNAIPKLDVYSEKSNIKSQLLDPKIKSRQSKPQLNTPLLEQDLATITAFLRERNALQSVNPRTVRNSFVSASNPTPITKTAKKTHVRTLTLPTEEPKPPVQLSQPVSTQSNLKSGNKHQARSLQTRSSVDEQKRVILQKLLKRLSALQAQSSNSGNGVSINGQSVDNNRQSATYNGQSVNNNGQSVNNNGMYVQNSNSQFNGIQMSTLRRNPSTAGEASSKTSPYNMMFRSIAMKEGASDAQEIMQDRMTEMGGAGALSMGMPITAMNSEVRSQLGSTLFENSPMAFLL